MPETTETTHSGNGSTTNADPVSFVTFPLNDNSTAHINARVLARRDSTSESKVWTILAVAKRSGETVTIIGNVTSPLGDPGAAGWDVSIAQNGYFLDMVSVGQTDATIAWYVTAVVMYIAD